MPSGALSVAAYDAAPAGYSEEDPAPHELEDGSFCNEVCSIMEGRVGGLNEGGLLLSGTLVSGEVM